MQNVEFDKENENPQHFPSNTASTLQLTGDTYDTPDISKATTADVVSDTEEATHKEPAIAEEPSRPKFSFASDYIPSRNFTSSFEAPSSVASYQYEPNLPLSSSISAFTVLNNDYGASSYITKPNAIVHPTRRSEETALPKSTHGRELRITGYPGNAEFSVTHPQYGGGDVHNFAAELNRKLSFLDSSGGSRELGYSKFKNSSQNGSNQETLNQRPLFITTVPRGIFLPPPKEIILVSPSRKRQLYAYSSHPVVYNATSSSSYYQNPDHHHQHQLQSDHTHNDHKIKANYQQQHQQQHHHQYSRNYSSIPMAKDKYQSAYTSATYNHGGPGAAAAGGEILNDGVVGVAIASPDKDLSATATSSKAVAASIRQNGVRGSYASPAAVAPPPLGGIKITRQQFQQQLEQNRSKRETPPVEPYRNVMYDRRVIRGSNYGGNPLLGDYDPFDKAAEFRRRQALRKRNVNHRNQRNVLGTPPPVTGRRHEDVQTDKYLEELVTRPPEFSVETQTDLFLEKPPTPPYIPAKVGVDAATEIRDGELFQFDAEAQPIIDVLVDSTLELSILEVAHEQEIDLIRQRQAELLAHREAELAELRRLEAEETRLQAEKERRLRQDSIAKSLDDEMQKEVTAAKLLQGHIASILPEILDNLEPATDAVKREKLMETLCPWLSAEVAQEVGHIVDSREILTVIIQEIIKQRAEIYADYKEEGPSSSKLEHIDEEENDEDGTEETAKCETESEPEPVAPR